MVGKTGEPNKKHQIVGTDILTPKFVLGVIQSKAAGGVKRFVNGLK